MRVMDSDLVIASLRGRNDAKGKVKQLEQTDSLALTSLTEYEVLLGAYFYGKKDDIDETEDLFSKYTVLSLDANSAKRAAKIRAKLMKPGSDVADIDVLIAAVVLEYGATLVTRNKAHLERIEELIVEEW